MEHMIVGVFDDLQRAEAAIHDLLRDKQFVDDDIGVVVKNGEIGSVLADDLGRDYTQSDLPEKTVFSRSDVFGMYPHDLMLKSCGTSSDLRVAGLFDLVDRETSGKVTTEYGAGHTTDMATTDNLSTGMSTDDKRGDADRMDRTDTGMTGTGKTRPGMTDTGMTGGMGTTGGMEATGSDYYLQQYDAGRILVFVRSTGREDMASRVLSEHGAWLCPAGTMGTTQRPTTQPTTMAGNEVHIPVIDEQVMLEKTKRQVGEVHITSETTERVVDVPTTVEHQEIRVERRKLDQAIHPNDYVGSDEEGVIRMPVIEEEVHVTKTPIVREELIITRVPVEERTTLRETVEHTEPQIETTGDVNVRRLDDEGRERPAA